MVFPVKPTAGDLRNLIELVLENPDYRKQYCHKINFGKNHTTKQRKSIYRINLPALLKAGIRLLQAHGKSIDPIHKPKKPTKEPLQFKLDLSGIDIDLTAYTRLLQQTEDYSPDDDPDRITLDFVDISLAGAKFKGNVAGCLFRSKPAISEDTVCSKFRGIDFRQATAMEWAMNLTLAELKTSKEQCQTARYFSDISQETYEQQLKKFERCIQRKKELIQGRPLTKKRELPPPNRKRTRSPREDIAVLSHKPYESSTEVTKKILDRMTVTHPGLLTSPEKESLHTIRTPGGSPRGARYALSQEESPQLCRKALSFHYTQEDTPSTPENLFHIYEKEGDGELETPPQRRAPIIYSMVELERKLPPFPASSKPIDEITINLEEERFDRWGGHVRNYYPSQEKVMGDLSAEDYIVSVTEFLTSLPPENLPANFDVSMLKNLRHADWLHLYAFMFGGPDDKNPQTIQNLVAGSCGCNQQMLFFEKLIRDLVRKHKLPLALKVKSHLLQYKNESGEWVSTHLAHTIDYEIINTKTGKSIPIHFNPLDPLSHRKTMEEYGTTLFHDLLSDDERKTIGDYCAPKEPQTHPVSVLDTITPLELESQESMVSADSKSRSDASTTDSPKTPITQTKLFFHPTPQTGKKEETENLSPEIIDEWAETIMPQSKRRHISTQLEGHCLR